MQVICRITAESGSSHLEYSVQFQVPQHRKDIDMHWKESSGGLLG